MKNIKVLIGSGFYCHSVDGGDYVTCPCCDGIIDNVRVVERLNMGMTKKEIYKIVYHSNDNRGIPYCDECKILSFIGCLFEENGCTSDVYNGHFIAEWTDTKTGEKHIGMPKFEDDRDWYDRVNDINIVKLYCPNNGAHSTRGAYPKRTHPERYKECCLKKNPYYTD